MHNFCVAPKRKIVMPSLPITINLASRPVFHYNFNNIRARYKILILVAYWHELNRIDFVSQYFRLYALAKLPKSTIDRLPLALTYLITHHNKFVIFICDSYVEYAPILVQE